ncbi:hypothetical protein PG995_014458 [Apiospora arundinis]
MTGLQSIPNEVFDLIVEPLVVAIGIRKAVRLRTVSREFDTAILHAMCDRQVVDIHDPATPGLHRRIGPELRGRIIAVKSRSAAAGDNPASYLAVVARVNQVLDSLIEEDDPESQRRRHEAIAASALPIYRINPH